MGSYKGIGFSKMSCMTLGWIYESSFPHITRETSIHFAGKLYNVSNSQCDCFCRKGLLTIQGNYCLPFGRSLPSRGDRQPMPFVGLF